MYIYTHIYVCIYISQYIYSVIPRHIFLSLSQYGRPNISRKGLLKRPYTRLESVF